MSAEIKTLNLRLPKDLWVFVKQQAIRREMPVNQIIIERLNVYRKKNENVLTNNNTTV